MLRSFPLELELMIAEYSIDELRVLDAQRRRAELRLVCRAWRDAIDLSAHLIAHGYDAIERARVSLQASERGSLIKSVHLYIEAADRLWGEDGDEWAGQAQATVNQVLALVPNATAVELVGECYALSEEPTWDSDWTDLSPSIIRELSHLPNLTSLWIGPDPDNSECLSLPLDSLAPLFASSTRLTSLDLTGCRVFGPWPTEPPSTHATALSRLVLGAIADVNSGYFFRTTEHLPATLVSLVIDHGLTYEPDYDLDTNLAASLDPFPAGLRHLALLDTRPEGRASQLPSSVERGFYDALLARAHSLRTLAISPCAVSTLSSVLGPLAHLAELSLVQGWTRPATPLAADEVVAFLASAPALAKISVSAEIHQAWSEAGKGAVLAVARRRGVKDVLL